MTDDRPYLLLTPGPLSTTRRVKEAMLRDLSTWDDDYKSIVQRVRRGVLELATDEDAGERFSTVLMQGSGSFVVESAIGSFVPEGGRLCVMRNGAYGDRIVQIAECLGLGILDLHYAETQPLDAERLDEALSENRCSAVMAVHCETTTGMLNPLDGIGEICRRHGVHFFVDAMSSFAGLPMTMDSLGADVLISSSNKCVQGVPGFGFAVVAKDLLQLSEGWARSVSLDMNAQWRVLEEGQGKFRFTSPTHTVLAFDEALRELEDEGSVTARHERYAGNQRALVAGMRELGFRTLLPDEIQSPIITAFHDPIDAGYAWRVFYDDLKQRGFVIYPGKVTGADTFRIGSIGDVHLRDVGQLLSAIGTVVETRGWRVSD